VESAGGSGRGEEPEEEVAEAGRIGGMAERLRGMAEKDRKRRGREEREAGFAEGGKK